MDFEEVRAEVERIQDTLGLDDRITALREHIDGLDPGDVGRAAFLATLAGELMVADDPGGARTAADSAIDDGGPMVHEPRCVLLDVELDAGNTAAVDDLLAWFLARARAGAITVEECEWIADSLEDADRLRDALRWHNIMLRDLDPRDVDSLPMYIVHARSRVRRDLDLPKDAYDEASELLRRLDGMG